MTNEDFDFEVWFSNVSCIVLDKSGVEFHDTDSVRDDYDSGRSAFDVADEIAAEYNE